MKAALTLAVGVALVAVTVAAASGEATPDGGLAQLAGAAGCVTETGSGGACADGRHLVGTSDVVVSPDGKHVYAAASGSDAVVVFTRDAATGALTEIACVSKDGSDGLCGYSIKLDQVRRLAISPDGKNVYAASEIWNSGADGVAVLSRNPETGRLSPLGGFAGCVSEGGLDDGCNQAVPLADPTGLAVSPDGRNVYVTSRSIGSSDGGVATLARDATTGELTYASNPGFGLGLAAVAISPDGRNVYVGGWADCETFTFARETGSGALTRLPGSVYDYHANCVESLVVSPDGRNVYLAAYDNDHGGVNVTARDPETGAIAKLPGTDGCVGFGADLYLPTCVDAGPGLLYTRAVTISPDGRFVYGGGVGVVAFARDGRGVLTRVAGEAGCTRTATFDSPGCTLVRGVEQFGRMVVSPDGRHLYAAATDGVVAFERLTAGRPVCEKLDPVQVRAGQPVTVSLRCTDPNGDKLTVSIVDGPERGRLAPIDQTAATVVYTPPTGFQGKDVFSFAASDGASSSTPVTVVLYVSAASPIADVLNPRIAIGPRGIANLRIAGLKDVVVRGTVVLRAQKTGRLLGRASFTIPAGRTKAVPVRLNAVALRGLRKTRTLRATAVLTAHGPDGKTRIAREPVTLRAT